MSHDDTVSDEAIVDRSLDDAVEAAASALDEPDRESIRRTLAHVTTEDGVVDPDVVDDRLAHLSKVVSTPETRTELAEIEFENAREAAADAPDLATVAARMETFESRLEAVQQRTAALGEALSVLTGGVDDRPLYETAAGIRELTEDANAAHRSADELQVDLEEFQRWLAHPGQRFAELDDDLDAVAESLDSVAETADRLAAERDADDTDGTALLSAWVDATLRHRVFSLLLADVEAELADLCGWGDVDSLDDADYAPTPAEVEGRLGDLRSRWERLGDRLDAAAREAWTDRYGEELSAFSADVEAFDPPVDWAEVQALQAEYRDAFADLRS